MRKAAHTSETLGGLTADHRQSISLLNREMHGVFSVDDAAAVLSADRARTARLLPYLAGRGWLKRVKGGLYITVPLEATDPEAWTEDPWVIAYQVLSPAYIGGWSAGSHWGLTDQLFRTVAVYTQKTLRNRKGEIMGVPFLARRTRPERFFGITRVWRSGIGVEVSDQTRTLVDVLDDPSMGGGIRHVSEMVEEYFTSSEADQAKLLDYIDRFGNRAICKRLGYITGRMDIGNAQLPDELHRRRSRGIALLDPALPPSGRTNSDWEIDENASLED